MKTLLACLIVTLSVSALAAHSKKGGRRVASEEIKCSMKPGEGIDPDFVIKQISAVSACYEASRIAESCGAGSSMDARTTGEAIAVCDKDTGKLSDSDAALKQAMQKRCEKICDPSTDGTLCIAERSFCRLDVSKFLNTVNPKN